eukprot:Stramenopile-MAST_4_protein_3988
MIFLAYGLRVVKKEIRREDNRKKNIGVYYNLLFILCFLIGSEGVMIFFGFTLDPWPAEYDSTPWGWCSIQGFVMMTINILTMWISIVISVETWFLICFGDLMTGVPWAFRSVARRGRRGTFYALLVCVCTAIHLIILSVYPGFGKVPLPAESELCGMKTSDNQVKVQRYHWLTVLSIVVPFFFSVRLIVFVCRLQSGSQLVKFATRVMALPIVIAAVNTPLAYARIARIDDLDFQGVLEVIAATKGMIVCLAIVHQNQKLTRLITSCGSQICMPKKLKRSGLGEAKMAMREGSMYVTVDDLNEQEHPDAYIPPTIIENPNERLSADA